MTEPAAALPLVVKYVCEGCGQHVFAFGIPRVPTHCLCMVCAWFCEHLSPEDMATYRKAAGLLMLERHPPLIP